MQRQAQAQSQKQAQKQKQKQKQKQQELQQKQGRNQKQNQQQSPAAPTDASIPSDTLSWRGDTLRLRNIRFLVFGVLEPLVWALTAACTVMSLSPPPGGADGDAQAGVADPSRAIAQLTLAACQAALLCADPAEPGNDQGAGGGREASRRAGRGIGDEMVWQRFLLAATAVDLLLVVEACGGALCMLRHVLFPGLATRVLFLAYLLPPPWLASLLPVAAPSDRANVTDSETSSAKKKRS